MKVSITLLFVAITISSLSAQEQKTVKINDWNNIRFSGFVESTSAESHQNAPSSDLWYWGINTQHPGGIHCGQIAFAVNWDEIGIPAMYVRSTTGYGKATWAKVLHSKGDHAIDGKLTAKEVEIKVNTGADFVFDPKYRLAPLAEVESFIKERKHLPEIPSEKEMQENGLNLNEMQIKLLQKIEELTLYTIELNKKVEKLETANLEMEKRLKNK